LARHQISLALQPGTTIAGYEIVRPLGQGGFGITYEAINRVVKRRVAIKEFFPLGIASREGATQVIFPGDRDGIVGWALKRFAESTSALADLQHGSIIDVMNYVSDHGTGYMIMEHVDGDTFEDWLKARGGKTSLGEIKPLLDPICDALEYMHGRNLLHRDIAPDNIMLRQNGEPVLIDFGAIKTIEEETRARAGTSFPVAKRFYSSPEQTSGNSKLDGRTDVYSTAAVVYRALSGEPPADASERRAQVFDREPDPYKPLGKTGAHKMPAEIAAVIDSALSLRREERPSGVGVLRRALGWKGDAKDVEDNRVTVKVEPETPKVRAHDPQDAPKKKNFAVPVAATVLVAIVIGSFFVINRGERASAPPPPFERPKDNAVVPRAPQAISGESATFFNPATGSAAVWFSQNASGDYEFFDADGYHPRTGEKLRPVDRQVVDNWHRREEAKKKPKFTLADGHIACKTRYGDNSYATSIDEGSSAPYRCGCTVGYVWNANNTSCIARTPPLVERIAPYRWAIGGTGNCNVPGRVYSLILSASDNMTWLEGTGAQYQERIVFSGDQEFHTQTVRSASGDAPGTSWVYRSSGSDRLQIFKGSNAPTVAVRCP
jgi:serine/threonine protein kinase